MLMCSAFFFFCLNVIAFALDILAEMNTSKAKAVATYYTLSCTWVGQEKSEKELLDFSKDRFCKSLSTQCRICFFGIDKSLSLCVSKYLCYVTSKPIKVKRREVPLIRHMEEFGLILSYERWRGEL